MGDPDSAPTVPAAPLSLREHLPTALIEGSCRASSPPAARPRPPAPPSPARSSSPTRSRPRLMSRRRSSVPAPHRRCGPSGPSPSGPASSAGSTMRPSPVRTSSWTCCRSRRARRGMTRTLRRLALRPTRATSHVPDPRCWADILARAWSRSSRGPTKCATRGVLLDWSPRGTTRPCSPAPMASRRWSVATPSCTAPTCRLPCPRLWVRDLAVEAGLPEDLWQIVLGPGRSIGTAVVDRVRRGGLHRFDGRGARCRGADRSPPDLHGTRTRWEEPLHRHGRRRCRPSCRGRHPSLLHQLRPDLCRPRTPPRPALGVRRVPHQARRPGRPDQDGGRNQLRLRDGLPDRRHSSWPASPPRSTTPWPRGRRS